MRWTTSAAVLLCVSAAASCGPQHEDEGGAPDGQGVIALPGSIHTVAGTGAPGYNGEGLPAREESLFWPDDAAVDPDGRLCILDWNNHRVRLRDPDGTLRTVMGGTLPGDSAGDAATALLNHPTCAAWDSLGRLVVACWHNHKVKRLDGGIVEVLAGGAPGFSGDGGPATAAQLRLPSSVLYLGDGSLLVLDSGNQRIRRIGTDGVITTFAGKGTRGYSGDGGPAIDAEFNFPEDAIGQPGGKLALERGGGVLVADAGNHAVRRIRPDGILETVAGTGTAGFSGDGGPAAAAQLQGPCDVEAARDGSIYVADRDNRRVRRVDPSGVIETFAGGHEDAPGGPPHAHDPFEGDGGPAATAPLVLPTGIALDRHGNLYIVDKGTHTVRVVVSKRPGNLMLPPKPPGGDPDPDPGVGPTFGVPGTIDTVVGTGATAFSGDGRGGLKTDLYWPISVGVRPSTGELILSDWNNHRVRMVRTDGLVTTVAGNGFPGDGAGHPEDVSLFHPTGVAFQPGTEDLLLASWHGFRVKKVLWTEDRMDDVAGTGLEGFSGDGGPAVAAALSLPSSVAFDPSGNLFVTDEGNGRIRRIAPDGTITTFAGTGVPGYSGDGGPATQARLGLSGDSSGQPTSFLATDGAGRVFLADTLNNRVRCIGTDGTIITVAGTGVAGYGGDGGPAVFASLHHPVAVVVDGDGSLYIADRDNHVVRKVDPAGRISTVAGTGAAGFGGDAGPAASAPLRDPHGLALDFAGNLYLADLGNGRVRVVWSGRDLWHRVVFPILRKGCATSGCHAGAAPQNGFAFDDETAAYDAVVNRPSLVRPGWLLVKPGDAAGSYLYQKVDPTVPIDGDRMPAGSLPLTPRELGVLKAWIDQGAPR